MEELGVHAFRRTVWAALILVSGSLPASRADDVPATTFEQHVRPILKAYCLDCHGGGDELKGKLDLRLKRFAGRGGETGRRSWRGSPRRAILLDRIQDGEMPPGEKKVPPEQIAVDRALDRRGAPDAPRRAREAAARASTSPPRSGPTGRSSRSGARTPPAVAAGRPRSARRSTPSCWRSCASAGSSFDPEADRRTLIRRAAFDLTGPAADAGGDRRVPRRLARRTPTSR